MWLAQQRIGVVDIARERDGMRVVLEAVVLAQNQVILIVPDLHTSREHSMIGKIAIVIIK